MHQEGSRTLRLRKEAKTPLSGQTTVHTLLLEQDKRSLRPRICRNFDNFSQLSPNCPQTLEWKA